MNKLSKIITLLLFVGFGSYAQKVELQSAINYVKWNDLEKAKTSIDKCIENETTKGLAKTWYYSGYIYQAIADSKDEKLASLKPGALDVSLKSYKKALELDIKNNDYGNEIKTNLKILASVYLNQGVNLYQEKKYDEAFSNFVSGVLIKNDYLGEVDTNGIINCALAANKSGKYTLAAKYYSQLISMNVGNSGTYLSLSNAYLNLKDTTLAINTLKDGLIKYPQDQNISKNLFVLYFNSGRANEAMLEIDKSIQLEPQNANLYLNKGILAEKLNDFKMAEESYKKAIDVDSKMYNAICYLAELYYNEGVKLSKKANEIKDNAKYEIARKKYEDQFALALPLYEKAFELNPKDQNVLGPLRSLYSRAGNQEKVNMINKAIEEAKK